MGSMEGEVGLVGLQDALAAGFEAAAWVNLVLLVVMAGIIALSLEPWRWWRK